MLRDGKTLPARVTLLISPSLSLLCTMRSCRKTLLLLKLMGIAFLPVLEAREIKVQPEVTGYCRHDVTLPCHLIPGPNGNITQVQWDFNPPEGEAVTIIIFNIIFGIHVKDTFLKWRVEIDELSLIIRDVEMSDAGSYTCSIAAFPSGSFEGTVKLVVQEWMLLSSWVVSAIVIAVILLVVIMTAKAYLLFIRRRDSSIRHHVHIDTSDPMLDVARPSVLIREEDVVYSDVKLKPTRNATPSSNDREHTETVHVDDVTYSEVVVFPRGPK